MRIRLESPSTNVDNLPPMTFRYITGRTTLGVRGYNTPWLLLPEVTSDAANQKIRQNRQWVSPLNMPDDNPCDGAYRIHQQHLGRGERMYLALESPQNAYAYRWRFLKRTYDPHRPSTWVEVDAAYIRVVWHPHFITLHALKDGFYRIMWQTPNR